MFERKHLSLNGHFYGIEGFWRYSMSNSSYHLEFDAEIERVGDQFEVRMRDALVMQKMRVVDKRPTAEEADLILREILYQVGRSRAAQNGWRFEDNLEPFSTER